MKGATQLYTLTSSGGCDFILDVLDVVNGLPSPRHFNTKMKDIPENVIFALGQIENKLRLQGGALQFLGTHHEDVNIQ